MKVFSQAQCTEACCEQDKNIQHLRLPFNMKQIQQGILARQHDKEPIVTIVREFSCKFVTELVMASIKENENTRPRISDFILKIGTHSASVKSLRNMSLKL